MTNDPDILTKNEIIYPKNVGAQVAMISHKMNNRHPWQSKKSKSGEPFLSNQDFHFFNCPGCEIFI